jgi:hypothetical protein
MRIPDRSRSSILIVPLPGYGSSNLQFPVATRELPSRAVDRARTARVPRARRSTSQSHTTRDTAYTPHGPNMTH